MNRVGENNSKPTDYWTIIFTVILHYINKIKANENYIKELTTSINKLSDQITERFNYLKELYNLKVEIEMLKRKRKAQVDIEFLIKLIVAIILVYVIFSVIKSLF